MRSRCLLAVVTAMMMALTTQGFAGDKVNMKPGKWEITSAVQMPGMPAGMPGMSVTQTQCLKNDEPVPQDSDPVTQGDCETQDIRIEGDTVSWKMVCDSDEGKITSIGRITYRGATFEGEFKTKIPGQDMEITNKMTGRWIGPCD
jgi:hypothetical protein